jgi:hypothetical protein
MSASTLRIIFIGTWLLIPTIILLRHPLGLDGLGGGMSDGSLNILAYTLIAFTVLRAMLWYRSINRARPDRRTSRLERRQPESGEEYLSEFDFQNSAPKQDNEQAKP